MIVAETNGFPINGTPLNGVSAHGTASGAEADVQAQYQRLQADLAAAKERVAAAQQRIAARDAEIQGALRDELHRAQDDLANLAARHEAELEQLRRETEAEVARILAAETELPEVHHGE